MANRLASLARTLILRGYALTILLLALWAGYAAVAYLVRTVFFPRYIPEPILASYGRMQADDLLSPEGAARTGASVRAPLGHFHGVDRWYQFDAHNGCASSGCHSPLPHTKSREIRAFANMHATFMACRLCHEAPKGLPAPAMWVNVQSGLRQGTPPILELMRYVEPLVTGSTTQFAVDNAVLLSLLDQVVKASGGDPVLDYLLVQLRTSEQYSPVWRQALSQLILELPSHARGEYGAKIAPETTDAALQQAYGDLAAQAGAYRPAAAGSPEREPIREKTHAGIVERPRPCVSCHGGRPTRLDLEALGYSPARAASLRSSPVAAMMQKIQDGQPFHLPRVGGPAQ